MTFFTLGLSTLVLPNVPGSTFLPTATSIPDSTVPLTPKYLFSDANPWVTVTLAMIGKFQIAASFAVIYVYAGELMPTVVRSEAMGISSFIAGIGLLLFPQINALVIVFHILSLNFSQFQKLKHVGM